MVSFSALLRLDSYRVLNFSVYNNLFKIIKSQIPDQENSPEWFTKADGMLSVVYARDLMHDTYHQIAIASYYSKYIKLAYERSVDTTVNVDEAPKLQEARHAWEFAKVLFTLNRDEPFPIPNVENIIWTMIQNSSVSKEARRINQLVLRATQPFARKFSEHKVLLKMIPLLRPQIEERHKATGQDKFSDEDIQDMFKNLLEWLKSPTTIMQNIARGEMSRAEPKVSIASIVSEVKEEDYISTMRSIYDKLCIILDSDQTNFVENLPSLHLDSLMNLNIKISEAYKNNKLEDAEQLNQQQRHYVFLFYKEREMFRSTAFLKRWIKRLIHPYSYFQKQERKLDVKDEKHDEKQDKKDEEIFAVAYNMGNHRIDKKKVYSKVSA